MTLDTAWGDMICKQLITIQLDSSKLPFFFSPSCLGLVNTATFRGVCRVSGRCLGGVWWVSCTLRIVSGAYRCQINCNKSCRDDQLSVICPPTWPEAKKRNRLDIRIHQMLGRAFQTCNIDSKNCSELLMTNRMGLDRAPVEFQKLVFFETP